MTDPRPEPRPGNDYVQSFARGLAVIRSFGAAAPAQTLSEVAQRCGLTRAGARRILLTLEGLGYVSCDGREFRLAPRILELGFAYLSSLPVWERGRPLLEELVERTGVAGSAAVLDGDDVVLVLRAATRQTLGIDLAVGRRLPAWCTSTGRMLLAGLPDREVSVRLRRAPLQPLTPHSLTDPARLGAEIAKVREQGWCLVDQELEEGLVSLSAPVLDRSGRTVAALGLDSHAEPAHLARRLPALRDAANRLSDLLT